MGPSNCTVHLSNETRLYNAVNNSNALPRTINSHSISDPFSGTVKSESTHQRNSELRHRSARYLLHIAYQVGWHQFLAEDSADRQRHRCYPDDHTQALRSSPSPPLRTNRQSRFMQPFCCRFLQRLFLVDFATKCARHRCYAAGDTS